MIVIAPSLAGAETLNRTSCVDQGSILGLGLHASDEIDPITKLVKLRDSALLTRDPATFCMVGFLRARREQHPDTWRDLDTSPGIPSKKSLIQGFNDVISAVGISASGFSYRVFLETIKRIGPGDAIEIKASNNLLDAVYSYTSRSQFTLSSVIFSNFGDEEAAVLCFPGRIEKVSSLHKLFTWAGESKTPVVIVATGFGEEVRKTVEHNIMLGKLRGALLVPNERDELSHFVLDDLSRLTGSTQAIELPREFSIESCGTANNFSFGHGLVSLGCDPDRISLLRDEIDSTLAELPPHARVLAERRKSMVVGGKLTVTIPASSAVGVSHSSDEISSLLSLWSAFIKEKHFLMPDSLRSLPVNTFIKALQYVDDTDTTVKSIGVYLKRDS